MLFWDLTLGHPWVVYEGSEVRVASTPALCHVVECKGKVESPKPCTTILFPIPHSLFPSAKRYGDNFEQLIQDMVQDFPGYANRMIQRQRDLIKPNPLPSVITVGKPDFDPLPLPFEEEIPDNSRQVFLTSLERTYEGLRIVDRQVYYWLFLSETEQGWELVLLLSAVTDGERLLRLPESREAAISEAIRVWLRDYQFNQN